MPEIDVRKGMPSVELTREEFERRFRTRFQDPAFAAVETEIAGRGFLTGFHQFIVDPDDATAGGFLVR